MTPKIMTCVSTSNASITSMLIPSPITTVFKVCLVVRPFRLNSNIPNASPTINPNITDTIIELKLLNKKMVEIIIPTTSPSPQPSRQCKVAETANLNSVSFLLNGGGCPYYS